MKITIRNQGKRKMYVCLLYSKTRKRYVLHISDNDEMHELEGNIEIEVPPQKGSHWNSISEKEIMSNEGD